MIPTLVVFTILLLILAYIWGQPLLIYYAHHQLRQKPFPPAWQSLLERRSPFYQNLPSSLQKRLQGQIQIFIQQKQFIGCNGLKITDEMRILISAQACLLSLFQPDAHYPRLDSILVYPNAFNVKRSTPVSEYVATEERQIASGESWGNAGQVILSWDNIEWDLDHWQDGHNVIFHEFAHQLDQADGVANGVPRLKTQADYHNWARVFSAEYQQLLSQLEHGLRTVIDPYGATNPAEFFAVVSETFLENAIGLQQEHPQLYQVLRQYYQFDPLTWF